MLAIDEKLCVGCGVCIEVCPAGAITLIDEKATINNKLCTLCYQCARQCPQGAIKKEIEVSTATEISRSLGDMKRRMENLRNRLEILEGTRSK